MISSIVVRMKLVRLCGCRPFLNLRMYLCTSYFRVLRLSFLLACGLLL
jgi:hypothetical protein